MNIGMLREGTLKSGYTGRPVQVDERWGLAVKGTLPQQAKNGRHASPHAVSDQHELVVWMGTEGGGHLVLETVAQGQGRLNHARMSF
jgi:hypothetical protein